MSPESRRWWAGWGLVLIVFAAGQWYAGEQQRRRDARLMVEVGEIKAMVEWHGTHQ